MTNSRANTLLGPIGLMLIGAGLTRADDFALAVLGILAFLASSVMAVVRYFSNPRPDGGQIID